MKQSIFLFLFTASLSFGCNIISAGSYQDAQRYRYKIHERPLIKIILSLKTSNPDLNPPKKLGLIDGRADSTDHWYHIYFFDRERNVLLDTWVRGYDEVTTDFAFVGVNEGLQLGNWKQINSDDYNKVENEKQLEAFNHLVLDKKNLH
jgi:hypothetical protein